MKVHYLINKYYNYLMTMMKCFSLLAAKAEPSVGAKMLRIAFAEATTELESYEKLLRKLGLELSEVMALEPAPTNLAYMNYLLVTCALGTLLEGLVAILPCFWTYLEIARRHKAKLSFNNVEIYREWCSIYLSVDYEGMVQDLRSIVDALWDNREYGKYLQLFKRSLRYEHVLGYGV